jgi:hypothetical protein
MMVAAQVRPDRGLRDDAAGGSTSLASISPGNARSLDTTHSFVMGGRCPSDPTTLHGIEDHGHEPLLT